MYVCTLCAGGKTRSKKGCEMNAGRKFELMWEIAHRGWTLDFHFSPLPSDSHVMHNRKFCVCHIVVISGVLLALTVANY
jgi:hypothetical protein